MLPLLISAYDLNEALMAATMSSNYDKTLQCLMEGAKATLVSGCGRTAVGLAALVGDAEILELLIQSCEEPSSLDIFRRKTRSNSIEMEIDSTPDGMDKLEWEDEFNGGDGDFNMTEDAMEEEHTSLYYYYAKTFERTGAIMDDFYSEQSRNDTDYQDAMMMDNMHWTPLHYAAACGHFDCARILLEHGARVDILNMEGLTPLHVAESTEVTRLLLKHGANPNLKTLNTGETALHLAIRSRCSITANVIIQTNVNFNETDDADQTPLMCAIQNDLNDVAMLLIDKGARINLQDNEGHTALYAAVMKNNVPLAKSLLEHGARRIASHYLLHHCVCYNLRKMAELLINHGDNLNVRNKEGVTPILLAIQGKKAGMLEFLLEVASIQTQQGKFVDRVENEMIIAVQYIDTLTDFRAIARILLAEDSVWKAPALASSSCYIPYCQTPLARAIMLNKLDIAEFLIKEGADISQICTDHVVNNLRCMVTPGILELAKLLVHAGFKYPYSKLPFPNAWKPERKNLEEQMLQLGSKPLTLQSLSRIYIRRHLIRNLATSSDTKLKYHATNQESSLSRMIKELRIPRILQTFLIDFDDCPPVSRR